MVARLLTVAAAVTLAACADGRPEPSAPIGRASLDVSAAPGMHVYQFRTEESADVSSTFACDTILSGANVKLGAHAWVTRARADNGEVIEADVQPIGLVRLCGNTAVRPAQAWAAFDLPSGRYVATGPCTFIAFNVPATGVHLVGCTLTLAPDGPRGAATSLSVFNSTKESSLSTGSYWTIQAYEP